MERYSKPFALGLSYLGVAFGYGLAVYKPLPEPAPGWARWGLIGAFVLIGLVLCGWGMWREVCEERDK